MSRGKPGYTLSKRAQSAGLCDLALSVPTPGFEPGRPREHQILNLACLPFPPSGQTPTLCHQLRSKQTTRGNIVALSTCTGVRNRIPTGPRRQADRVQTDKYNADRVRFELTSRESPTAALAGRCLRPLSHLSKSCRSVLARPARTEARKQVPSRTCVQHAAANMLTGPSRGYPEYRNPSRRCNAYGFLTPMHECLRASPTFLFVEIGGIEPPSNANYRTLLRAYLTVGLLLDPGLCGEQLSQRVYTRLAPPMRYVFNLIDCVHLTDADIPGVNRDLMGCAADPPWISKRLGCEGVVILSCVGSSLCSN